jgi:hypothetical protein
VSGTGKDCLRRIVQKGATFDKLGTFLNNKTETLTNGRKEGCLGSLEREQMFCGFKLRSSEAVFDVNLKRRKKDT